jgi:hypothetical protein
LAPHKLLFISNGHGEDAIAAQIVRRLPASTDVSAYPTLGDGGSYEGICPIVGPRATLPSEGWRNTRNSIFRDIGGGGIATIWPGLRFLREACGQYDQIVVVGDMIGVYGTWVTGHRGIVYLDVYKTGYAHSYLAIDRWILRRTARAVFCRAPNLAADLQRSGIDARAVGNVMMDTIPRTGLSLERTRPVAITILPGSRSHTLRNFALQAEALRMLSPDQRPQLFLVVAASVPEAELRALAGDLDIHYVPGHSLGDALDASDFVLAQAGTATIQAIGLGRPAITFRTPTDRRSRFERESRLFGEARIATEADPADIAAAITELASKPAERQRRGDIGRERIGPPGAINATIAELLR